MTTLFLYGMAFLFMAIIAVAMFPLAIFLFMLYGVAMIISVII
jgi:hypothetical protein